MGSLSPGVLVSDPVVLSSGAFPDTNLTFSLATVNYQGINNTHSSSSSSSSLFIVQCSPTILSSASSLSSSSLAAAAASSAAAAASATHSKLQPPPSTYIHPGGFIERLGWDSFLTTPALPQRFKFHANSLSQRLSSG